MEIKQVYICSEHTDGNLEFNNQYPLFKEIDQIFAATPPMPDMAVALGEADFVIKAGDHEQLVSRLEEDVRLRLAKFEAPVHPSTVIDLFGTRYHLDIRNSSHMLMRSAGILLNMFLAEQERNGSVIFYNMSPVDDINRSILSAIKHREDGIDIAAIWADIIQADDDYASLSDEVIQERLITLKEHQFITEEQQDEVVIWKPTNKTIKIDSIL